MIKNSKFKRKKKKSSSHLLVLYRRKGFLRREADRLLCLIQRPIYLSRVGSIISQDLSMSIHMATNKLGNDTNLF